MYQSYENIDILLETFPFFIFYHLKIIPQYSEGLPGFVPPPTPLRKLHKFKFTQLKNVSIYFSIFFSTLTPAKYAPHTQKLSYAPMAGGYKLGLLIVYFKRSLNYR